MSSAMHMSWMAVLAMALSLLVGCADAPRQVAGEILVLDGGGGSRECLFQKTICAGLRVRYDHAQEEDRPVSTDFLEAFDAWIEEAQANGKKMAFRCRHGWRPTGRLAAYYRIRFEGASAAAAAQEMQRIGRMMWRHSTRRSNPTPTSWPDDHVPPTQPTVRSTSPTPVSWTADFPTMPAGRLTLDQHRWRAFRSR